MSTRLKDALTFIRTEALSGVILLFAAVGAVYAKNSSFEPFYDGFIHGHFAVPTPWGMRSFATHTIVNDLLMTVFFLVVGLEIKREFISGDLSSRSSALLPMIGALGGMLFPALLYLTLTSHNSEYTNGWAIPTATDIAFSLGVLSLFGRALPLSLKVFLTALAIIDDLLAVLVIAFFYTAHISSPHLLSAFAVLLILVINNRVGNKNLTNYMLPGLLLFYFISHSGIHATVAGVLLAFTIPLDGKDAAACSPLKKLEHALHPWVAYGVLPVFAFTNAGVDLSRMSMEMLFNPVALGCFVGLFVGKQLGVFLSGYIVSRSGIASLPAGVSWLQFYGVSVLTGIGFTMSLFIGGLAFRDPAIIETVKVGVIAGSLFSMCVGAAVLFIARAKPA